MVFSGCFVGCYDYNTTDCECYYGVIQFSNDSNQLVVYNPKFGEVEIPETERYTFPFYDYQEENNNYQLKAGDFVSIFFIWEKNQNDNGVKILETAPAKFNKKADIISVYEENIFFEKTDYGYAHTFPLTYEIMSAEIGDTLYFVKYGGENGRGYVRKMKEAEIIAKTDDLVTVALIFDGDASWFFDIYIELGVEIRDF
jgi:hypothetical protein